MPVFLDEIVAATRRRVAAQSRSTSVRDLEQRAHERARRGFRAALQARAQQGTAVIAELKQASPSKGVLRAPLEVEKIAREYEQAGAAALSVLTEEQYFQGSLRNLAEAAAATSLPCLRKDFIIDEIQLLEAAAFGADAVLLIAAILDEAQFAALTAAARGLHLDVLCEVHDEHELPRALAAGCDLIGVNARDLRTFHVDLAVAERLASRIPGDVVKVAESGITTGADIARLRNAGFDAFLVGEAFMRAPSPGAALSELLRGAAQVALP